MTTAIWVFSFWAVLLVVGKALRSLIPLLQMLCLPSAVIGGVVGLIFLQCFPGVVPESAISVIAKTPGFLISLVFATLFLGVAVPPMKKVFSLAFPQLCFGQVMAWGQYVLGVGIAGFVLIPCFGVHKAFGNLLEIGFEGGHGTVGGMSASFESFHWADGIALGYTMATAGMVIGIVIGMMLVNWAVRRRVISQIAPFAARHPLLRRGIYPLFHRPLAGRQTVQSDSIDSLAWHLALVGIAMLLGVLILMALQKLEVWLFPHFSTRLMIGFPLFPLCMIGGVIVQLIARKIRLHYLIDHAKMQRISGASLDFLVVSAVATIRIEVVVANWLPLLILILTGTMFAVWMVIFVAPRLFREAWFERAIAEFGQATGVTATGLLLLRTVDPESRTDAAQAFGYKQLIHEPFMGGGIITALAFTLVCTIGWEKWLVVSVIFFILWLIPMLWIMKRNRGARQ